MKVIGSASANTGDEAARLRDTTDSTRQADTAATQSRRSPGLACLLSLFIVGAGQLYNGEAKKAAILFFSAVALGLLLGEIAILPVLCLAVFAACDALRDARRHNQATEAVARRAMEEARERARYEAETLGTDELIRQIQKVHLLAQNGLLDDDELSARKAQILGQLEVKRLREDSCDFLAALVPLVRSGALTHEEVRRIKAWVF